MDSTKMAMAGAVGAALVATLYIVGKDGAAGKAGAAVGKAAVDMTDGVIAGTVGGIGGFVGLPMPSETITDADQCLIYLNENGYWAASAKCSAAAFAKAATMKLSE